MWLEKATVEFYVSHAFYWVSATLKKIGQFLLIFHIAYTSFFLDFVFKTFLLSTKVNITNSLLFGYWQVLAEVDFLKDPHTAAARVISQYSTASPCNAPTGIDHVNNNGEVQVNGNNSVQHNPTKSLLKAETVIDDIGTDNGSLARCLILGENGFL